MNGNVSAALQDLQRQLIEAWRYHNHLLEVMVEEDAKIIEITGFKAMDRLDQFVKQHPIFRARKEAAETCREKLIAEKVNSDQKIVELQRKISNLEERRS